MRTLLGYGQRHATRKSQRELWNFNLLQQASEGELDEVKKLLQSRADIDSQAEDGRTALSLAAQGGHMSYVQIVQLLLQKDADIEMTDESSQTPLSWAAKKNGHAKIVGLLLDKKANFETRDCNDQTPLSVAAREGHIKVVRLLLEGKADIETRDCNYQTPLLLAVESDHPEVVELLLEKNAQIKDSVGQDPLPWAAKNGHARIVELLLKKDAALEAIGCFERTPLSVAAEEGHIKVVRLLLEGKADFETRDFINRTPLLLAVESDHPEVVELLLEKDAELEAKDDYGRTALSRASERGHTEVAKLLLEKNADFEEICWGQTPLSFAAENGHLQIVKLLLKKNAKIETDGLTPFDLAEEHGHDEVAALLLQQELKGDWYVEQLCWLIKRNNQDVVVGQLEIWPKPAKQAKHSRGYLRNYSIPRAPLPERLRAVLAPNEKNLMDISSDENCAAIIHSSNVEDLSQENLLWAPDVPVMLKVLPGVTGSDAINRKFLLTLAHTPHERIFETDAIQAMILAAWQQERASTWFEIISALMMVISLCVSSYGFRHGFLELAGTFLWVPFVLHSKKTLHELPQLLAHFGKKCIPWHQRHSWKCIGWLHIGFNNMDRYMNFDNVADLLYIGSGWAAIGRQWSCPSSPEKPCMAIFCGFSWLRLVYSLRGETWIGPRLLPILSAIQDTFAFFFLMTICIVAASHAYYSLEIRDGPSPTYVAIMQIVRLGIFGHFDMFEFEGLDKTYIPKDADNATVLVPKDPDPGPQYAWVHALFYITGVGITVLLMNVLISVLSQNYSKLRRKRKQLASSLGRE